MAAGSSSGGGMLRQARRLVQNYKKLSKFRLSLLVVATSSAGYAAGSREHIDWAGMGWTSLGTFMASASANALNQVGEAELQEHAGCWALCVGGVWLQGCYWPYLSLSRGW